MRSICWFCISLGGIGESKDGNNRHEFNCHAEVHNCGTNFCALFLLHPPGSIHFNLDGFDTYNTLIVIYLKNEKLSLLLCLFSITALLQHYVFLMACPPPTLLRYSVLLMSRQRSFYSAMFLILFLIVQRNHALHSLLYIPVDTAYFVFRLLSRIIKADLSTHITISSEMYVCDICNVSLTLNLKKCHLH